MKNFLYAILALCCFSFCATSSLSAQIYNQDITVNKSILGISPIESMVEIPSTGDLVVATWEYECDPPQSCNSLDVMIQVFDPTGAVIHTYRVGKQGLSERPYSITLCQDEQSVIVVGEIYLSSGFTKAFAMRIELSGGNIIWHKVFDAFTPLTTYQRFHAVTLIDNGGPEEYFLVGWSSEFAGNPPKLFLVRVDDMGNVLYSARYFESPTTGMNHSMVPSDISKCRNGNYVITGTYHENFGGGIVQLDVFLIEVDIYGQLVTNLHLYDVHDGTGINKYNGNATVKGSDQHGIFMVTFDTPDLFNPPYSNVIYLNAMSVDQGTYVPNWANGYSVGNYPNSRNAGVEEAPGYSNFYIGSYHNISNGTVNDGRLGYVELTPGGVVASHIQYDPSGPSMGGYCMVGGDHGFYYKGVWSSLKTYRVIRSDFNGRGPLACHFPEPMTAQPAFVSHRTVKMAGDNEPSWYDETGVSIYEPGTILTCTNVSSSFKSQLQPEESVPGFSASIYPTLATHSDVITVSVEVPQATRLTLHVSNLLGQVVLNQETSLEAGQHLLTFSASELTPGVNLVQLRDETGNVLLTQRIVKY